MALATPLSRNRARFAEFDRLLELVDRRGVGFAKKVVARTVRYRKGLPRRRGARFRCLSEGASRERGLEDGRAPGDAGADDRVSEAVAIPVGR